MLLQRFFRFLKFDSFAVASMVITLFDLKNKKLKLALDRTNWKFGKIDINILMLTVAYKGIALPLMWSFASKKRQLQYLRTNRLDKAHSSSYWT
ncbi:MAG: hypothetical protein KDK71_07035 [Chlamydiia bacterium]|nr:hypothetical protein [Chlamydiia bacterium]